MSVIVVYYRYATRHEHECETVDEAVRFLAWGGDQGTLSSSSGEIRDGDRVIAGDELASLVLAAWNAL